MQRPRSRIPFRLFTLALLLASTLVCGWTLAAPYWLAREDYEQAVQSWAEKQPQHYQYNAIWQGTLYWVEVEDGAVVQVVDRTTNRRPDQEEWSRVDDFVVINQLFETLKEKVFQIPPATPRDYLNRIYPGVVNQLVAEGVPARLVAAPCAMPVPTVRYNEYWTYPETMSFHPSPDCQEQPAEAELIISNFVTLP